MRARDAAAPAAAGLALWLTACAAVPPAVQLTPDQRRMHLAAFDQVWATVRERHFDPDLGGLDWVAVRDELRPRVARASSAGEVRRAIEAMIGRLGQSHFQLLPAEIYRSAEGQQPPTAGGAVGLEVRMVGERVLVTRVVPGSPAADAGVRAGWEIAAVGGRDIRPELRAIARQRAGRPDRGAYLAAAVRGLLAGPVGSRVTVMMRDGGNRARRLDLRRTPPEGWASRPFGHFPSVAVSFRRDRLGARIGYVAFNAFLDPARLMPLFNDAVESFLDAEGVVIDLRGNMGGLGDMLPGMAGWFIGAKGTSLGTIVTRAGSLKLAVTPRPSPFTGRVAVIVDDLSMSAAEVMAQGLKDAGRARVFGGRTAGAVLASTVERLPNGDGFQYPIARFEFPSGAVVEGVGVTPDVEVRPTRETLLEGRDVALEAAVAWLGQQNPRGQRP
ncbi:MAG TPA: S41 family peptidase [Vicinamibacterales bacterium]|nr:S41 family peptidase [Vicinamibacterales bacterium]HPW19998.1 S41 family peptidase [Vicinamibacterales bacterium]